MSPVYAAKLAALAAILLLTVGLKAVASHTAFAHDQASLAREHEAIAAWLIANRFTLTSPAAPASPFVQANKGRCTLAVIAADPRGFHRSTLDQMAAPGVTRFFIYRAARYAEQPLWRTLLDHHLWARSRDLGLARPRHLVLGLLAQGCDANALRLAEVDVLP